MGKRLSACFLMSLTILLFLAAAEIFLLRPVIDMISFSDWVQLAIYCILIIVINPIIAKMITNYLMKILLPKRDRSRTQI
ncbi:MAG: hypothetical protein IKX97_00865 [Erysipelotrichaceae bacterium]|nr:hypothetical protein [Erysipelotrichaceae bacterium]